MLSSYSQWACVSHTHNGDAIMDAIASQITSLTIVYSAVYSDPDERKHQSSASLAFVWGIHRDRWIPRTKDQLRGKCFHLMTSSWIDTTTPFLCKPKKPNLQSGNFIPAPSHCFPRHDHPDRVGRSQRDLILLLTRNDGQGLVTWHIGRKINSRGATISSLIHRLFW